jgi:flagellar hook-basal body complex protein FliE
MAQNLHSIIPLTEIQGLNGDSKILKNNVEGIGFSNWMNSQLSELNHVALDADKQLQALALGNVENLHHVMIGLEKAKLTFNLAVQIRNKLLEGYQDVMRMQV